MAWAELTAVGYSAFTMEGVATRAKTSRAVLYRRWPNRPELAGAAIRHQTKLAATDVPTPGRFEATFSPCSGMRPAASAKSQAFSAS